MSTTQTAKVAEQLRALIFCGQLPADSTHLESELAQQLGVSRTPVREAALQLQASGLVEVRPRKGIRVKAVSIRDIDEIYEVLTELESFAAARAAGRRPRAALLVPMREAIDAMDAALERQNLADWADADEAFHTALVTLGGNRAIMDIVAMYADQVRRARWRTLLLRPLPTQSNKDHRAVLEAIERGDREAARRRHARHRMAARDILTKIMRERGVERI